MSGKKNMPENVTIIIPSYAPDDRLLSTVLGLIACGADDILIVNDGSGREYDHIFAEAGLLPGCTVLVHDRNLGKGAAIKTAMAYCVKNTPALKGIVTVDGDGHHKTSDIVSCAQRMVSSGKVILGIRDINDKTISPRGKYGNRITSFAISIVCGFKIQDPLTGLRGIPAKYLSVFIKTAGNAYDFETNMILDIKRNKIPFRKFDIICEYFPDGKKSHFRLFRDSMKIAVEIIKFFGQQFKYLLSSMVCYAFEYIIYRIMLGYLPVLGITLINYICRLLSGILNFVINKNIVFRTKKKNFLTALKYIVVVLFVMLLSTELIVVINNIFHTESNTVAKFIKPPVDFLMFFLGYFLQRKWVFSSNRSKNS